MVFATLGFFAAGFGDLLLAFRLFGLRFFDFLRLRGINVTNIGTDGLLLAIASGERSLVRSMRKSGGIRLSSAARRMCNP